MTAVQDRPRADAGTRRRAERPKPSRTARLRVSVRIARRQVRRTWVSSLLIMSLIALPIAGMAGVAVYVASIIPTPQERLNVELGEMAGRLDPLAEPGSGFWQAPYDIWTNGTGDSWGTGTTPTDKLPIDPRAALPAGASAVPVSSGRERVETRTGLAAIETWAGDVADPRFSGRFDLVAGRAPQSADEVLVTPATLERTDTTIGSTLTFVDDPQPYTITGTIDASMLNDVESAVAFFDAGRYPGASWFVPEPVLDVDAVETLNDAGFGVYSRELVLDPPSFELPLSDMPVDYTVPTAAQVEEQSQQALALALAGGGIAAGYMVVMLAGAAFAVSARRQQRALAIAASVGAEPRDLRRIVLLQGTVLGLVGGAVGLAAGIGLGALVMRVLDNGSATQFWGFHVPWPLLGGILVFAVLVGSASAWMPARNVGRADTISALRGARRPLTVTASRPLWGSLLIAVGIALTIVCGIAAGAVAVNDTLDPQSPLRWLPTAGIVGGPILAQIGILVSGRWLLWLASRVLSRWGVAARIAARDAVANGARTVPAFAAIGATVFVGVFAVAMGMMSAGQSTRSYGYSAPLGTVVADISPAGAAFVERDAADAAVREIGDYFDGEGAISSAVVSRQADIYVSEAAELPADLTRAIVVKPERSLLSPDDITQYSYSGADPQNNLSVIEAGDLDTAMGITLTDAERAAYADGSVLVTDDDYVTDGRVDVAVWTARDFFDGKAPGNIWENGDRDIADPRWERRASTIAVSASDQSITAAIAPATARAWGIDAIPTRVLATFPDGSEMNSGDRLNALAAGLTADDFQVSMWRENGPPDPAVWLVPLLAAVAVLVLGASAVALGLARFERRPDDATLAAVGGTPGLRRRIGLWQGLVIAGFGTFAGATAGILPPIGFWLQSQTSQPMTLADIPWWLLAALAVALPVGIAAVNWIVPPRTPELTRRNVIA
jgi:putative ABC transport system permease protein